MKFFPLIFVLLLIGCAGSGKDSAGSDIVSPEADKHQVIVDARLIQKCPAIDDQLSDGSEKATIDWARLVLQKASDCRKAQWQLIDWVNKTFAPK